MTITFDADTLIVGIVIGVVTCCLCLGFYKVGIEEGKEQNAKSEVSDVH